MASGGDSIQEEQFDETTDTLEMEGSEGAGVLLPEDEEAYRQMQASYQREIQARLSMLDGQFKTSVEEKLGGVGDRYGSQQESKIATRQTDLLRVNKIFRDLARNVGDDWKPVFQKLMAKAPQEDIQGALQTIEKERSFMQAYKALQIWKDYEGQNFQIRFLVDALTACNMYDLAESTLNILTSEGDSLLAFTDVGKGITSGRQQENDMNGTSTDEAAKQKSKVMRRDSKRVKQDAATGVAILSDSRLLSLSKKLGGAWVPLASHLGVPEEETNEIKASEGETYQGAFKMLWSWKDSVCRLEQDNVTILVEALKKSGKPEIADDVNKWKQ